MTTIRARRPSAESPTSFPSVESNNSGTGVQPSKNIFAAHEHPTFSRSDVAEGCERKRESNPIALILIVAVSLLTSTTTDGWLLAQSDDFENEPIQYSRAVSNDPVAKLKGSLEAGKVDWTWDTKFGWLPSLLKSLEIPVESQVLVFSKTSLQIHKISPTNPRALYFNDSVYVGFVPGSNLLELAANDTQLGAVFYTLDSGDDDLPDPPLAKEARLTEKADVEARAMPRLLRDKGQCLACHATSRTDNVPGYLIRSIYSDHSGRARTGTSSYVTDYRSPFEQRWGGWYVTGTHGSIRHMGNAFAIDRTDPETINREQGANLVELPPSVDEENYLAPHSDIVALMVLEHQARVHNLITRAAFEAKTAIFQDQGISRALDRDPNFRSESTLRRIERAGTDLLEAILYADEIPLRSPVNGTSKFAESFSRRSPTTAGGKSLFQLDLRTRLFRFPLSYLIYTPEFNNLPEPILAVVRSKLQAILNGESLSGSKVRLTEEDRAAILEILRETKTDMLLE